MKCDDIKLLFDEYLEGTLPAGDASMVREHLKKCPDCRDELQFLRKYLKKAGSLPVVKAPDDFMDRLHRRLDAPVRGAIVRRLFFPLKIKVPLEAAALLALAVTGLLIFKPFRTEITDYSASGPGQEIASEEKDNTRDDIAARRSEKPPAVPERERNRDKHSFAAEDAKVASSRVEETVASEINVSEPLSKEKEKASSDEQVEITLYLRQNVIADAGRSADDSFQARDQDRAKELSSTSRKSLGYAKKDKAASEGAMQYAPSGAGQASLDSIAGLARSLNGRIIKQTEDGNQVIVEIPGRNYSQFMKGLRGNWSVQTQSPAELPGRARKAERVQFNINVQK